MSITNGGRAAATRIILLLTLLVSALLPARRVSGNEGVGDAAPAPAKVLSDVLSAWADVIEPPAQDPPAAPRTWVTRVRVTRAAGGDGRATPVEGATFDVAFQSPDRLRVEARVGDDHYLAGRHGRELWAHVPAKRFGVVGSPDVPRFKAEPDVSDGTVLPPFALPVSRYRLAALPLVINVYVLGGEKIDGVPCQILRIVPPPTLVKWADVRVGDLRVWVRDRDRLPARITYASKGEIDLRLDFSGTKSEEAWPGKKWDLTPTAGDKVERVALSHLTRFLDVIPKIARPQEIPSLGPTTGERRVVETEGDGQLEEIDGTRVLFLKGSPEEMGRQHGTLLKKQVRDVTKRVLYGVGVGSSFAKGNWFFGEIESAQARLEPFTDPRHLREAEALATAAGLHPQEGRLANFFPELFHCSGFALAGKATKDGRLYHGRVLDYMRGIGLEQNAVVIVYQPDDGRHAWVNLSYAGFVGTVSAMNEKGVAVGEMGGGGYGAWDGKPMSHLLREVMENAATLDEAVEIMRKGPRTCEYYYVVSDGKTGEAVGIAATPETFDVIEPGAAHPRLAHPIPDAVLLSAGDRYEELVRRVRSGFGQFDADSARELMTRPVCMSSNIQSVLFAPSTLDLWVANADSDNVASHTRYTHYNLRELLK